jgi:cellulose synthase/poly-beta-1,6-N-acetylglucosamine synthase-like glycosyltransferase
MTSWAITAAGSGPSFALWMAVSGIVWTTAGIVLLLWGWATLKGDRPPNPDGSGLRNSRKSLRVVAGGLIAGGACVLGAIIAGQGGLAAVLLWTRSGPAILWGLLAELVGATRIIVGFERIGAFLGLGVRSLLGAITFGAGLEGRYVVANQIAVGAAVACGGMVGWMSASSRWTLAGVATYIGLDLMALGFVAVSLAVVESSTNLVAQALGIWLVGVVLFGFVLFLIYQFYALEHLAGSSRAGEEGEGSSAALPDPPPFVLVQIASYNEPPDVVQNCLESALALDYPRGRFRVQLCDDSTDSDGIAPLAEFCRRTGVDFQHREHRRGFKGGALNDGLRAASVRPDLIAIIDSDYVVEPRFLRRVVPGFHNPRTAFVQTPQAYRNAGEGSLGRWYELADAYFYRVVQPVRARFQSLIFCGTMGVLRREALVQAGGWSEECVTEDAELTIRMLALGWEGRYLPEVMGRGLAPDLMTAVRSQQRRWAFGGIQMLRMNRRVLASRRLSFRQRWDFRLTGLFWFDGLFLVGVTGAISALVAASWFGIWLPFAAVPAPALIAVAPVILMIDGLLKIRASIASARPVTLREVFGVLSFWYAIKLNDLRAALRAWIGSSMPFVRTPKFSTADAGRWAAFKAAVRSSTAETAIAAGLVAIVATSLAVWRGPGATTAYVVFLAWLGYYAYAFASAPWFDYRSRMSLVARQRRAEEKAHGGSSSRRGPTVDG